jgi:hypothetical protein
MNSSYARYRVLFACIAIVGSFSSCLKSAMTEDGFVEYLIRKGGQSSSPSPLKSYNNQPEQRFIVRFDSTAHYKTVNPTNQQDINKLYGFADNDKSHQIFSARIGWRWLDEKLELHAYVYNDSVRSSKLIKAVPILTDVQCSIRVDGKQYVFTVDGTTATMPRTATSPGALGYRLYPFFGGDESAPQDIRIRIKEY